MYNIILVDGQAVFATHKVYYNTTLDLKQEKPNFHYDEDDDGPKIICYGNDDLSRVEIFLNRKGVSYTIQTITTEQEILDKTNGVFYQSIEEILDHLTNNITPESLQISELQQENTQLKTKLTETEDALLTIMFGGA